MKERILEEVKKLLQIGAPIVAAQVLLMSMGVVDTIMAGNLSALALAAVSVGGSTMMPFFMLCLGILNAISPAVAQHRGARRLPQIGVDVRQGVWLSQFLALPFFLITRNLDVVMHFIDVDVEIIPDAMAYLRAYSWGIFPIMAYLVLRFFNEGLGNSKPSMFIAGIGLLFNIPLNYTLIYGKFGLPALGAEGCGWATAAVSYVMFICLFIYTFSKKGYKRFQIFNQIHLPKWSVIKELIVVGLPIGITSTMEVSTFALVSLFMAKLGTTIVAGHQIALNVASTMYMIPLGVSMAITTRVGQASGAGNADGVQFRGRVGILFSLSLMVLTASFLTFFPEKISTLYSKDAEVLSISVQLMYMAALFQFSDGLQVSAYGALKGLKDTKFPMIVNFIAYWAIGLPLGYYLGLIQKIGPQGLWIGLIAGLSVAAFLHNSRFYYLSKTK